MTFSDENIKSIWSGLMFSVVNINHMVCLINTCLDISVNIAVLCWFRMAGTGNN